MARTWVILAAVLGLLSVALGAFGAHALEASLSPRALGHWTLATRYMGQHVVALVAVAWLADGGWGERSARTAGWAGVAFAVGVVIFSGSLSLMAITGARRLGALTPIGGVALLAGWALLGLAAARRAPPSG